MKASDVNPLDNAEKAVRLARLYAILSDVNHAIVRIRDKQALFDEVCRIVVERGQLTLSWIGFTDKKSHLVKPVAWYGNEAGYLDEVKISVEEKIKKGQGPTGSAIREKKPFVCNDIEHDKRMLPWKNAALNRGYRSSASFPIVIDDASIGAISVYATETNFFDDEETDLMTKLAKDIAYAIEFIQKEREKKDVEEKLRKSEERFRLAIRGSYAGIWDMNVEENEIYFSPQWKELFGYEESDIPDTFEAWENLIHPDDKETVLGIVHRHWEKKTPYYTSEHRLRCKNGDYKWILSRGAAIWDEAGKPLRMAGSTTDITHQKAFEEKLQQQEEFLAKIINTSPNFIIVKDREGKIVLANQTVLDFCGKPGQEIIGKKQICGLVTEETKIRKIEQEEESIFLSGESIFLPEVKCFDKEGKARFFQTSKIPLLSRSGEVKEVLILSSEITQRKEAEETVKFHAYHDSLTGLANRLLFEDHLQLAVYQAERNEKNFAVMYLDLDSFKPVNDNYGHGVGDGVLQEVGRRLHDAVRKSDTVARLGGDEFTILVTELEDIEDAANVAQKIVDSFKNPFVIQGCECRISTSIGISVFPGDGREIAELLKNADTALLEVKKKGKNNYLFYSP